MFGLMDDSWPDDTGRLDWKETCAEYPEMMISMGGRGWAKDNIWIERFWRTKKI